MDDDSRSTGSYEQQLARDLVAARLIENQRVRYALRIGIPELAHFPHKADRSAFRVHPVGLVRSAGAERELQNGHRTPAIPDREPRCQSKRRIVIIREQ